MEWRVGTAGQPGWLGAGLKTKGTGVLFNRRRAGSLAGAIFVPMHPTPFLFFWVFLSQSPFPNFLD
jgi:hypothetical protein